MPALRDHGGNFGGNKPKQIKTVMDLKNQPGSFLEPGVVHTIDKEKGEFLQIGTSFGSLFYVKENTLVSSVSLSTSTSYSNFHFAATPDPTGRFVMIMLSVIGTSSIPAWFVAFDLSTKSFSAPKYLAYGSLLFNPRGYSAGYKGSFYFFLSSGGTLDIGGVTYNPSTGLLTELNRVTLPGTNSTDTTRIHFCEDTGEPVVIQSYGTSSTYRYYQLEVNLTGLIRYFIGALSNIAQYMRSAVVKHHTCVVRNNEMFVTDATTLVRISTVGGTPTITHTINLRAGIPNFSSFPSTSVDSYLLMKDGKLMVLFLTTTGNAQEQWNAYRKPVNHLYSGTSVYSGRITLLNFSDLSVHTVKYQNFVLPTPFSHHIGLYGDILVHDYRRHGILHLHSAMYFSNTSTYPWYLHDETAISFL